METNHLKLKQGKIYIPGNRRRNSRTLNLDPSQILELYEYFRKVRPKLLKHQTDQLIISMECNTNLKNSMHQLFKGIKKAYPEIKKLKQIRSSLIVCWLNNHNLRQVQCMAGHKYVSSTERYQLNNLNRLQSNLEKYHHYDK